MEESNSPNADDYGRNLLMKLGWFPGRGIGRNPKGEIESVFRGTPRPGRLGVGAELPGEELVAKKALLALGDSVTVSKGKHAGVQGVISHIEDEYAVLELGQRHIRVPLIYLDPSSSSILPTTSLPDRSRKELQWIAPGIRVRIISKQLRGGSLYNSKGVVQDVTDSTSFTLLTDSHELLDELIEKDVETLIPAVGKLVMVLAGEHRGEAGKLMDRDKRRNRVTVQLTSALHVLKLTQDEVSEIVCPFFDR